MKGLFITLEGSDGTGKTTQCNIIKKYFDSKNIDSVILRDPGSTKIGEQIRNIITNIDNNNMSYYTETFLYAAARAQLVAEVIKPLLENKKVIICDRFLDSSLVYQGISRKIGIETVKNINMYALENIMPDITFFLNLDPKIGLERKYKNKILDRMENQKEDFYKLVQVGYNKLCKLYSKRIIKIDASKSLDEISKEIISNLESYILKEKRQLNEISNSNST